jgi:hemerythrin-like domain-containing protein
LVDVPKEIPMSPTQRTPRLDSFTPIHKGLRRLMFEAGVELARTDFADAAATSAAERAVATCLRLLREHADVEDRHVLPLVERADPDLAQAIALEHPSLERAAIAVDTLWPRLAALEGTARIELGDELVRRFNALVAEQLRHLDREERQVNAALWAALTDAEIGASSVAIVRELGPERMAEWGQVLAKSLNASELAAMEARRAKAT